MSYSFIHTVWLGQKIFGYSPANNIFVETTKLFCLLKDPKFVWYKKNIVIWDTTKYFVVPTK